MRIGLIGVGVMGGGVGRVLAATGFPVSAYDKDLNKREQARSDGMTWTSDPAELAAGSDYLLLSLPGPAEIEEVLLGREGALQRLRPGAFVMDLSTTSRKSVQRIADAAHQRGINYYDCPVSGRAPRLTVLVGGPAESLPHLLPILDRIAVRVLYVGEVGSGCVAKLLCQYVAYTAFAAMLEAQAIATRAGTDPRKVLQAFDATVARNGMLPLVQDLIDGVSLDWCGPVDLVSKDFGLLTELLAGLGLSSDLVQAARREYTDAHDDGFGSKPFPYMVSSVEQRLQARETTIGSLDS